MAGRERRKARDERRDGKKNREHSKLTKWLKRMDSQPGRGQEQENRRK